MNRPARFTLLTWLAGVLVAASVVAGWIAIGRLASATQRGLARTEQSLVSARELATNATASATELQRLITSVGEGLGSTADALVATRQVSAGVRGLLDVVSVFNRVENLSNSLTDAEAAIANVEIDLSEASGSIEEAAPVLDKAVASMRSIPDELDRSIAEVESSRARIGQQVWLWRLAIAAGGAALALVLVVVAGLWHAVNDRPALEV
jgi:methyl-accepting chemotaxis protein